MKYAVYVLMVEDTEENDLRIAAFYPEQMERAAGNLDLEHAQQALRAAELEAREWDEGIAR